MTDSEKINKFHRALKNDKSWTRKYEVELDLKADPKLKDLTRTQFFLPWEENDFTHEKSWNGPVVAFQNHSDSDFWVRFPEILDEEDEEEEFGPMSVPIFAIRDLVASGILVPLREKDAFDDEGGKQTRKRRTKRRKSSTHTRSRRRSQAQTRTRTRKPTRYRRLN